MILPAHTHRGIRKKGNNSRKDGVLSSGVGGGGAPRPHEGWIFGTGSRVRMTKVPVRRGCLAVGA